MNIILLERVRKLGQIGDVVKVRSGYARNFLLPQKKALRATKDNIASFDLKKTEIIAQNLTRRQEAEAVSKKMQDVCVTLIRQAGESGFLYGSVRPKDIADLLSGAGYQVERTQIDLSTPIKTVGIHAVAVQLHPEVSVSIRVNVAQSLEEASARVGITNDEEDSTTEDLS